MSPPSGDNSNCTNIGPPLAPEKESVATATASANRRNAKFNLEMNKLSLQGHEDVDQTASRNGPTLWP